MLGCHPVYGLGGIAMTLTDKLVYLCSELELVNQKNQFHRQRNKYDFDEFKLREFFQQCDNCRYNKTKGVK
ncbi:hypothetical protein MKW94_017034 [Papaver nudicaule]|uniref:Uncharacterized protein n=1 Tax=Papaver nudicaule TaxID=74823 RepID=A0AA41VU26_PAPNU|nr:hypothetical protein [Papaver nudicaule]